MNKKIKVPTKILSVFSLISFIFIPILSLTSCQNSSIEMVNKEREKINDLETKIDAIDVSFNKTSKAVSINLIGQNLSDNKSLYKIKNITNNQNIDMLKAALSIKDKNSIFFHFIDTDYVGSAELKTPVYEVTFSQVNKAPIVIRSTIINEPIIRPTILIDQEPANSSVNNSTTEVTLTTKASIKNPINGQNLSYQWFSSITNDSSANWTVIDKATSNSFKVLTNTLNVNTKNYYKCTISYKGAISVDSRVVYVELLNKETIKLPVITITKQPTNQSLSYGTTKVNLSVNVTVDDPIANQKLVYQWFKSEKSNGQFNWIPINHATSASFELLISSLNPGVKTYFICSITYSSAVAVDSEPIFVEFSQLPSDYRIGFQPESIILAPDADQVTFSFIILNNNSTVETNAQWFMSDSDQFNSKWTNIIGANHISYGYNTANLPIGVKKFFRCEVYINSIKNPIYSNVVYVIKKQPSVISIKKQPQNQQLTIKSSNIVNLSVEGSVTEPIDGENIGYQWFISDAPPSLNNVWFKLDGETNNNLTINVGQNISLWQKRWYKCVLNYPGANKFDSSSAFVEVNLSIYEAKNAFDLWIKNIDNQKQILTQYFNAKDINEKSSLYTGYNVLWNVQISSLPNFKIKNIALASQYDLDNILNTNDPTWKVELLTTTEGQYKLYNSQTNNYNSEISIPINSLITFYLPFNLGTNKVLPSDSSGTFNMIFSPKISNRNTSLVWEYQKDENIKSYIYQFKVSNPSNDQTIFISYISKPKFPTTINSNEYKFIPVFNLI